MTFRDFLRVLGKRWRIVVLSLLVTLGAAAVQTLLTPRVYTASAKVYLSAVTPTSSEGKTTGTYVITKQDLETYVEVLNSPPVLDPLRARLGLGPGAPLNVSAAVSDTSNMLTITAISGDPELAARTANTAGPVLAEIAAKKFSPLMAANGQVVESTPITPATAPGEPTSPNVKRNLALGTLLGFGLGVALALIIQAIDTKVRSQEDIKELSDSPILGKIPVIKVAGPHDALSLETDPHGRHAEAIRRLRTNIMFVDVTTGAHSFVITSAMPSEGKTTAAINLAMAMADSGIRVLLIDGDLRNPSVARTMGIEGSAGLTTVLLGHAQPADVIQQRGTTSMYVLPAGQIPPNPSELLGSEPMESLFGKLSHEFDFILIDSPPVVPVIDAVILNKLTHGLLMVVAADRTRKRDVASAVASLQTVGAPIAGFALNMLNSRGGSTYRYGHYGHYGQAPEPPTTAEAGSRRDRMTRSRRRR